MRHAQARRAESGGAVSKTWREYFSNSPKYIAELPPDKVLDFDAAEKVLGFVVDGTNSHHGTVIWRSPCGHATGGYGSGQAWDDVSPTTQWHYTALLLKAIKDRGWSWWFADCSDGTAHAHVRRHPCTDTFVNVESDSLQKAITIAALKAVEVGA